MTTEANTGLAQIRSIQKQIVAALEVGGDISALSKQLAQVRAGIAAETEIVELKAIAVQRQALRDRAEEVKARVAAQSDAIDQLLELRGSLVKELLPLLGPAKELAQLTAPPWLDKDGTPTGDCYLFSDESQFSASVKTIPKELFPPGFACPRLEMSEGSVEALGQPARAAAHLQACIGLLQSLKKGQMAAYSHPADASLLLDNVEAESETGSCIVCEHGEVEAINSLLRQGKSFRSIESEFGVSRSTLSRHKAHLEV